MGNDAQADLRVTDLAEFRRTRQSTSSRRDSQTTAPLVSRSMLTASFSPQRLPQSATLARCPTEVSQRRAKSRFPAAVKPLQKSDSSMLLSHHTVLRNATPNGIHTGRCETERMAISDDAEVRRRNLWRFCVLHCGGEPFTNGQATDALANLKVRAKRKGAYLADLLKPNTDKSFGEKSARKLEDDLGLFSKELDIENSPLRFDPAKSGANRVKLLELIPDLSDTDVNDLLIRAMSMKAKRRAQRSA